MFPNVPIRKHEQQITAYIKSAARLKIEPQSGSVQGAVETKAVEFSILCNKYECYCHYKDLQVIIQITLLVRLCLKPTLTVISKMELRVKSESGAFIFRQCQRYKTGGLV